MFHASLLFAASWNERAKYVVRNVAISLLLEMLTLVFTTFPKEAENHSLNHHDSKS
jgi:hypothetical protein